MKQKLRPSQIIGIVVIAALGIWAMFATVNSGMDNIEAAAKRKESDFIYKSFTLDELWYREISNSFKTRYVFLKPREEKLNLSFGMDRIFTGNNMDSYEEFAGQFRPGDKLRVKLYQPEYEAATRGGIWQWLKNFVTAGNNEAEIYELQLNGDKIYEQDIHNTAINFRSGGDLSAGRILVLIFVLLIPAAIIGARARRRQPPQPPATNV